MASISSGGVNTYKAFDSLVDYREVNPMVTWSFRSEERRVGKEC